MKLKVTYKTSYGAEHFYPYDEWTKRLFCAFHPPSVKSKAFSRRQIDILKELGFEIEAITERVEV
jgi:hypothetical protein